jgi:hypothetical protein
LVGREIVTLAQAVAFILAQEEECTLVPVAGHTRAQAEVYTLAQAAAFILVPVAGCTPVLVAVSILAQEGVYIQALQRFPIGIINLPGLLFSNI